MSEFVYTGQRTSYEEWKASNGDTRPRRYVEHDPSTGRSIRYPSRERGGDPAEASIDVTGQPIG